MTRATVPPVLVPVLLALLALCGAANAAYNNLPIDGTPVSGTVQFLETPWQGQFTAPDYGSVLITLGLTGDTSLRGAVVTVGLGYMPSDKTYDWFGQAVQTYKYPINIDALFINQTYYVAVTCEQVQSASFQLTAMFQAGDAPSFTQLQVGDIPFPGQVQQQEYTYFTFRPDHPGNVNVTAQIRAGHFFVLVNPNKVATLGDNEWQVECDGDADPPEKSCAVTVQYVRPTTIYYVSVYGSSHSEESFNRFYLSVDPVQ